MSQPTAVTLGEVVASVTTWSPAREAHGRSFTYLDLSAVDQDTKVISGARELPRAEAPSRARQIVSAGDVLVSTVRPNLNGVARVPSEMDGATASTGFCVLRPRPERLDGAYLFHWVKSPRFIEEMARRATGASYPAVTDRIVAESTLPLPALPEQRRIAGVLDRAEALRAKRRAALALLDTLTQSIFLEMFGNPSTNSRRWPTAPLGELGDIGTGSTPSRTVADNFGGCIPWVKTTEVDWGVIRQTEEAITRRGLESSRCKIYPKGSLVVALYGQGKTRGKAAVLGVEAATNQACGVVSPSPNYDTDFLLQQMRLSYGRLRALSRGGNQENLNLSILSRFVVLSPPMPLQRQFADRVRAVGRQRTTQNTSAVSLDALFASLQHRAFRGEL